MNSESGMTDPVRLGSAVAGFPAGADTSSPPPRPETASAPPPDKRSRAVDALMHLAADRPWSDIEITDVADAAGLTLSEMRDLFPSKGAILDGFTRMIDKKVIEGTSADLVGEPARERVFDVVIRRLDAMTPYRRALRRIGYAMRGDLGSLAALNRSALNSARYMLAAAGVPSEGPLGYVKLQGLVIAQANVMETWFDDDDPTQAKTMARLDRELGRGERVLERAEDFRRLTAPLRALGQAVLDGRNRMRRRGRDRDTDGFDDGETKDPAAAI
ncbi:TetR/AcrR family transcriptional regulator [uncultured Enterovirga sp.]|uniref:TetR/AcrR family transcriptional regulator n=1 Tax=uncultured Enterovirga sp. TaxID=2026352 RepID=UPI0035CA1B39